MMPFEFLKIYCKKEKNMVKYIGILIFYDVTEV